MINTNEYADFMINSDKISDSMFNQHLIKTRPSHRSLATSQTSELVGKAPKTCNSYPDAIFK